MWWLQWKHHPQDCGVFERESAKREFADHCRKKRQRYIKEISQYKKQENKLSTPVKSIFHDFGKKKLLCKKKVLIIIPPLRRKI